MIASKRKAAAMAAGLCMALAFNSAHAQQQPPAKPSLEGVWNLVSIVNEKDGVKTEPSGPNPVGLFTYDRSGIYTVQIFRRDLPPMASGDRTKTTPAEDKAVNQGVLSHFGTYKVDEKAGTFTIRPIGSSFANWTGKEMLRRYEIKGDELKIINPSSSKDPTSTSYLILKRAK